MTQVNSPDRIPATIVTGFLGSGKTTLIRRLLETANGRRMALIVNEFGDVGFDGALLADCGEATCGKDDIVELANGCICCTVADEFLPAMEALLARQALPDHIIIETSGLALPQPLVKAFNWPGVKGRVTVDGVVTVVDAEAVAAGRVAADEAAIAHLIRAKGVGRWSAEIYLLFALGRPDIWPADDLAVQAATARLKGLSARPTRAEMIEIGAAWRPYRSAAARFLWHLYHHPGIPDETG